ncbi:MULTISPECIES: hypothetical protein [Bacteria]|uniref:hypothetical protein n=1 Tax=Bacteria TaxID=2 RepID=UPI001C980BF1|nr:MULTISPECIES: hypothetical protein [Bacteria]MDF3578137.1 hypothetical protein [Enterobacter hormaechei]
MASPSSVNMIPDLNESLDAQLHQPLVIPQNEGMLTQRSDIEALYESLALCSRTTSSVQNIALRLKARTAEVRARIDEVESLRQLLKETRMKNRILTRENRELRRMLDSYAKEMDPKITELEKYNDKIKEVQQEILDRLQKVSVTAASTSQHNLTL